MSRESGYYWVSSLGLKPEIAEWDSSNNTWQFIGAEGHFCGKAIDEDPEFKVVSTRISTPDEERTIKFDDIKLLMKKLNRVKQEFDDENISHERYIEKLTYIAKSILKSD